MFLNASNDASKKIFEKYGFISYVAFHAKFFTYPAQIENNFDAEIISCIEDIYFFAVMIRPKNSSAKPIRWDVSKNFWQEIQLKNLKLSILAENLILLES